MTHDWQRWRRRGLDDWVQRGESFKSDADGKMNEDSDDEAELIEGIDLRLHHPQNIISVGATNTGKTFNLLRILKNPEYVISNLPENYKIYYVHGPYQEHFKQHPHIRFFAGWDHEPLSQSALQNTKDLILVLDDCYHEICPHFLRYLWTALMHHNNFTIFLLLHHLYSQSVKFLRELTLNTTTFFFSYSPVSKSMVKTFAYQYFGDDSPRFLEVFDQVLKDKKYSYLVCDFSPHCLDRFRLRTALTEEEYPMQIFLPKRNNSNKKRKR